MHTEDDKLSIFRAYSKWVEGGKKRDECPNSDLVQEYGCHRTYPKVLYDRVMEKGSTRNNKPPGRPAEFSPGCWEAMVEIIRTARSTQKPASVRKIAGQLKKSRKPAGKKAPSKSAIALKKMSMGFKWHAVKRRSPS